MSTSLPQDLSQATPVEIDTALAEIMFRASRPESRLAHAEETVAKFHADDNETRMPVYTRVSEYDLTRAEETIVEAEAALEELRKESAPLHAEWDARGGWPRFWHVTNTNGHVHNSMRCSSCFPDTRYAWRTDLSGLTEAEVVEREAYQACSVCMPIAPAEQKAAFKAHQAEKRAAKAAEKAAKAAEKAAKKLKRDEALAHKVNKVLDETEASERYDLWCEGKIQSQVFYVIEDMRRAPYTPKRAS
jgi:hypothetical protein